jgi:hypothetical protein
MADDKEPKKLTPEDPIAPEVLKEFNQVEEARYGIAMRLLELEQSRVKLLAAAHQVDQQQQRLFEKVLLERGLAADAQVSIDSKTGRLEVLQPPKSPQISEESPAS